MRKLIKERALLKYDVKLSEYDCDNIIDKYLPNIVKDGEPWIRGIDSVIKSYLG